MPFFTDDGQQFDNEMLYRQNKPTIESQNLSQAPKSTEELTRSPEYDPKTDVYQTLDKPYDFVMARHGDTEENETNTVREKDSPLNEDGVAEAHKIGKKLQDEGVTAIHASALTRSKETAGIIHADTGIPVTFDPRLNALDVGKYEGQPCDTANPEIKDYIKNRQDEKIPGGESFNDFTDRTFAGIRDAILNNKDGKVGILTHNSVHALYDGWEKTGQDNPDIDYNQAVKEESAPGTVVPKTMQPDSTIINKDPFEEVFRSASKQAKGEANPFKKAAQIARAGVASLAGKAAEAVTGPIQAAGRVIERYERAMATARGEKVEPHSELDDPTSHVLDMISVLGATGLGMPHPGPGTTTAGSIKVIPKGKVSDWDLYGPENYHIVRNVEGEPVIGSVSVHYSPHQQDLGIGYIHTTEPSPLEYGSEARRLNRHSNALTRSEVMDLIRSVASEYPEAKTVSGWRVSGLHSKGGSSTQTIPIPERFREQAKSQLKDYTAKEDWETELGNLAKQSVVERKAQEEASLNQRVSRFEHPRDLDQQPFDPELSETLRGTEVEPWEEVPALGDRSGDFEYTPTLGDRSGDLEYTPRGWQRVEGNTERTSELPRIGATRLREGSPVREAVNSDIAELQQMYPNAEVGTFEEWIALAEANPQYRRSEYANAFTALERYSEVNSKHSILIGANGITHYLPGRGSLQTHSRNLITGELRPIENSSERADEFHNELNARQVYSKGSEEASVIASEAKRQLDPSRFPKGLKGSLPGEFRRDPERMKKLQEFIREGKSYQDAAEEFNVSRNTIAGIVNRAGINRKKIMQQPSKPKPFDPSIFK